MHTHTHTSIHPYIHTSIQTYIHTRTYMHTYIHSLSHTTSSFTYNLVPPNCFYFSILHHLLCLSFLLRPATTFVAHYWKKLACGVILSFNFWCRVLSVHGNGPRLWVTHTHTSLGWLIAFSCTCTCTSCYASALLLHLHTLLRFG